jgi:hypothetical protein
MSAMPGTSLATRY